MVQDTTKVTESPVGEWKTLSFSLGLMATTKIRNPVMKIYWSTKIIQMLNQAKTIWDPPCKQKGLLSGHLGIQNMTPKQEQLEYY